MIVWTKLVAGGVVCMVTMAASADIFGAAPNEFTIDFVTIAGDAGSANGTSIGEGKTFSDPAGGFRVSVFEITSEQWDQFRTAYGPVTGDPPDAYNMTAGAGHPYWPANCVSWYEAAQFVNWLNTSTGHHAAYRFTGDQGTSTYTFTTWPIADAAGGTNLYRHKDAFYYLPTEDEWVKAAYWNGTVLQTYATKDGSEPIVDVDARYGLPVTMSPTDVGCYPEELNGTFDMMGNALEWMENPYDDPNYAAGAGRCQRGGSCIDPLIVLASSYRDWGPPEHEHSNIGFRVAADVPEPGTLGLAVLGFLAAFRRNKL